MSKPDFETTKELTAKLALLMADRLTLPPDDDRLHQIFNTAAELRRCMAGVGEFDEDETDAMQS